MAAETPMQDVPSDAARGARGGRRPRQRPGAGPGGTSKQHSTASLINSKICKAEARKSFGGVLDVIGDSLSSLSLVNISTAVQKLARMHRSKGSLLTLDHRFNLLLEVAVQRLGELGTHKSPRCWSTIVWSLATMEASSPAVADIFALVAELSEPRLDIFKPLELTNLLWAFAKVGFPHPTLFDSAHAHVLANLSTFTPPPKSQKASSPCAEPSDSDVNWSPLLSALLWSFTYAQVGPSPVMDRLAADFCRELEHEASTAHEITNFLWAVATASLRPEVGGLKTVGDRASALLQQFKPDQLAICCWAYCSLGLRHEVFFQAVLAYLRNRRLSRHIDPYLARDLTMACEWQPQEGGSFDDSGMGYDVTKPKPSLYQQQVPGAEQASQAWGPLQGYDSATAPPAQTGGFDASLYMDSPASGHVWGPPDGFNSYSDAPARWDVSKAGAQADPSQELPYLDGPDPGPAGDEHAPQAEDLSARLLGEGYGEDPAPCPSPLQAERDSRRDDSELDPPLTPERKSGLSSPSLERKSGLSSPSTAWADTHDTLENELFDDEFRVMLAGFSLDAVFSLEYVKASSPASSAVACADDRARRIPV